MDAGRLLIMLSYRCSDTHSPSYSFQTLILLIPFLPGSTPLLFAEQELMIDFCFK